MSELDALVDRRPMILKLAESQSGIARKNLYTPAWSLGIPQKDSKNYKEAMAMDACCRNVLSGALKNDVALSAFPLFVGYGFLSNLAQEGLIRAGVETIADDMTRKPVELYYDDEGGEEEEDKITKLKAEMVKYKVRERMNTSMLKDGYFGGCLVYIDVGKLEDDEAELPLVLDEKTFKKGSLRGFKVIEPVNIAPGTYNTTDPTADDYFNPNWYYILGRKFHKSRFLYIASNETPLLLKAAYNFFGIPQAQLALDYVAHFVANRESAQELLNKFSLTCFGTDMSQGLQTNGSWADLIKRMKMFNKMKNNNGTFVYNKETEELSQINTPLSGVREIVEMSLNLLTAIWRIPKIRYIGEGEGGLNASSVEQMRSYYDYINAMQEKVLTVPYETILKILQLNLGMTPDEKLMFKFPVLWDMDEQERANLNKIKADTMATYLANGIISQEEARRSLSMDRNSGFTMIDAEDVPEPVEEPLKDVDKEEQDEEDKQAMDEWNETDHPRDDEGKFTDKVGKRRINPYEYARGLGLPPKITANKVISILEKNGFNPKLSFASTTDSKYIKLDLEGTKFEDVFPDYIVTISVRDHKKHTSSREYGYVDVDLMVDYEDQWQEDFIYLADKLELKGSFIDKVRSYVDVLNENKQAMDMALDGRWITIGARERGEEGEDDEGRKGRHIYLDDGETPEEAIEELKKDDKKDKKPEEKKELSEPKEPIEKEKSDKREKDAKKVMDKKEYGKLSSKLKKLMYEKSNIEDEKQRYLMDNEEIKELSEKIQIAKNRYFGYNGHTEENRSALSKAEAEYDKRYAELSEKYLEENNYEGIKKEISDIDKAKLDAFAEMKDGYLEKTSKMTDEELKSRLSELHIRRRDVQNKNDEALSNNLEYKDAMMRKSDLLDARWAIVRKDYLSEEEKKKLSLINQELEKTERKCENFVIENEESITAETIEMDAEMQAIEEEKTKRYQKEEKIRKENLAKAKEEKAKMGKKLAKDNFYPKTIAGVSRGKEMSEEEADSGNPNPNYGAGRGYGINCQSCVVCYEARLRGYDVMTLPNTTDSKLSKLAHDTNMAWIDPKTGLTPVPLYTKAKNSKQCMKFLEENVKSGERYNFSFGWKRSREGHIVSITRNKENQIEIYDPQTNQRISGDGLSNYLRRLSYGDRTKVVVYGEGGLRETNIVSKTELLRVDNLAFNPEFMNDIMEAKK